MVNKKTLIWTVVFLVVVGIGVTFASSGYLQGLIRLQIKPASDTSNLYMYHNKVVSTVTTPVTSIITSKVPSKVASKVTSKVTSKGGTSKVASKVTSKVTSSVPSTITTPVTSAVAVRPEIAATVIPSKLLTLTREILNTISKREFIKNPSKFILSKENRARLIRLYTTTHR